jgi:hypothetical protein
MLESNKSPLERSTANQYALPSDLGVAAVGGVQAEITAPNVYDTDIAASAAESLTPALEDTQESSGFDHESGPGMQIEYLRVGETKYKVVLCRHDDDNAEAISNALQGAKVLAVEQPGHNNGNVRRDAGKSQAPEKVGESLRKASSESKQTVLIDMHEDDPQYGLVIDADEAELTYHVAIYAGDVDDARDCLEDWVITSTERDIARDATIRNQLAEDLPARFGDEEITVLLGGLHYHAIVGLDPNHDGTDLRDKIHAWASTTSRLTEKYRETGVIDPVLVDEVLVRSYFKRAELDVSEQTIHDMPASLRQAILASVNTYAHEEAPWQERGEQISAYMRAVHDFLPQPVQK